LLDELIARDAVQPAPHVSVNELSKQETGVPITPPWYVEAAQRATTSATEALSSRVIEDASRAVGAKREMEATDLLVEYFDDLFLAGEFEIARRALVVLNPQQLPPKVLTGVLMVTRHARDELGAARVDFCERVRSALAETWRLPPEAVDAVVRRLT